MDRHNEILLDDILLGMAATSSKKARSDLEIKKLTRKGDCYAYIAKTIRDHRDNEIVQNGTIKIYSLGGHLGHCIMVDKDNNIIADNFKDDRENYDRNDGSIKYKESQSGTAEMGASYKLDENSFSIEIKEYLKVVDDVKNLIDYKSDFKNKGKFVGMLNDGLRVDEVFGILDGIKPITEHNIKKEAKNNLKNSL